METIGFYTPYKHLPKFKEFVESKFICRELTGPVPGDVDYLFCAPNYARFTITDKHIEGTGVKAILTPSTGTNHINVTTVPVYDIFRSKILKEIYSTAEHNLYLCLQIVRQVPPILELRDLTLGIMGYGRLGKMLKRIAKPLFKEVLTMDIDKVDEGFYDRVDMLSININLTPENENIINGDFIDKFKKDIYIVNTARGEVVEELELVRQINSGKVKGYATDVVKEEHTASRSFLTIIDHPKIFITPHVGGTALSAQEKAYREILNNIL